MCVGLYAICVWNWNWWLTQDHFLIKHWSQCTHRCLAPVVPWPWGVFIGAGQPLQHGEAGLNNSIGPIARNCPKWPSGNHICGPKLPTKLVFWKFGQQTFSCVNQLLTAHPMRSRFWEAFCHLVSNQLLFMVSMISSPLYFDYMTS